MKKNKGWCWFCHHDIILEYCTDFAGRVKFIKKNKPANEISARLNAFRFVKGKLPKELLKARAAYDKARAVFNKAGVAYNKTHAAYEKAYAALDKACAAYDKARVAYNETYIVCSPQIIALFKKECPDVQWNEENQTLKF